MSNEQNTNYFRDVVDPRNHPNHKDARELQAAETDRQNRTGERHRDDFNRLTKGFAPPIVRPRDPEENRSRNDMTILPENGNR